MTMPRSEMATSEKRWVLSLTLAAAAVRALWLLNPVWDIGDSPEYLAIADGLLRTGSFTSDGATLSSYRPPLYPALIAAASLVTRQPIWTVLVVQTMLGALTVTLAYLIARRAFSARTASVAAVLLAVAPMTCRFASVLHTETLFTFLVVFAVWAYEDHRYVSGLSAGLAILTRAAALPFVVLVAVLSVLPGQQADRRALRLFALTALLTIAPWVVRNYVRLGHFTVADAGWGANLLYGAVDLNQGSNRWTQLLAETHSTSQSPPSPEAEQRARELAFTRIRDHPFQWLIIRAKEWPWLFLDTGDYLPVNANAISFRQALVTRYLPTVFLKLGFLAGNLALLCFALRGALISRARLVALASVWSFPLFLALAHLPMYVEPRYGLPLVPFLAIFAARGLERTWIARASVCSS
jgi:4-amino-4-deoxy-L-arabinose transferase-like glycosyltransferase